MPAAGQRIRALDFTATESDTEATAYTFTNTSYGVAGGAGYADCGVAFVANTEGKATVHFAAQLSNSGANATMIAPHVREGAVVGSGADFFPAADAHRIFNLGSSGDRKAGFLPLTGLTPGNAYNVRLEHKTLAGTGTAQHRTIEVTPDT